MVRSCLPLSAPVVGSSVSLRGSSAWASGALSPARLFSCVLASRSSSARSSLLWLWSLSPVPACRCSFFRRAFRFSWRRAFRVARLAC